MVAEPDEDSASLMMLRTATLGDSGLLEKHPKRPKTPYKVHQTPENIQRTTSNALKCQRRCCLVVAEPDEDGGLMRLRIANLGDSGLLVYRPSTDDVSR